MYTFLYLVNFLNSFATCRHNSLVGTKTTSCSPFPGCTFSSAGNPNAAVFPDPVCDSPMTSFPCWMRGMHCSCISVNSENPKSISACSNGGCSLMPFVSIE